MSSIWWILQHERCFGFILLYLGIAYNRVAKLGIIGAYGGVDILYLAWSVSYTSVYHKDSRWQKVLIGLRWKKHTEILVIEDWVCLGVKHALEACLFSAQEKEHVLICHDQHGSSMVIIQCLLLRWLKNITSVGMVLSLEAKRYVENVVLSPELLATW